METKVCEKNRKRKVDVDKKEPSSRGSRSIYLNIDKSEYESMIDDAVLYRTFISYEHAQTIISRMWDAYHEEKEVDFCDTLFDLQKYVKNDLKNEKSGKAIDKIVQKVGDYAAAYKLSHPYRTSNMVDRQMKLLDSQLFSRQYFHGHLQSIEEKIRAWALIHNFMDFAPRTKRYKKKGEISRVHQLNGFVYHQDWLKNLMIAGSLNGRRFNPTIH